MVWSLQGSNGAAGTLAVLTVLPQSCCEVPSVLGRARSKEMTEEMGKSRFSSSSPLHEYIVSALMQAPPALSQFHDGPHLRLSLLGLKLGGLCLTGVWIGMKPCLLSFSGAASACYMESMNQEPLQMDLTPLHPFDRKTSASPLKQIHIKHVELRWRLQFSCFHKNKLLISFNADIFLMPWRAVLCFWKCFLLCRSASRTEVRF